MWTYIRERRRECIVSTQPVHLHLILTKVEAFNLFRFIKLCSVTNKAQLCRNPLIPHQLPHLSPFLPPSPPSPDKGELPAVVLQVLTSHWYHGQHKHTHMCVQAEQSDARCHRAGTEQWHTLKFAQLTQRLGLYPAAFGHKTFVCVCVCTRSLGRD